MLGLNLCNWISSLQNVVFHKKNLLFSKYPPPLPSPAKKPASIHENINCTNNFFYKWKEKKNASDILCSFSITWKIKETFRLIRTLLWSQFFRRAQAWEHVNVSEQTRQMIVRNQKTEILQVYLWWMIFSDVKILKSVNA